MPVVTIFPKLFHDLGASELATLVREVGADTVDVVIRDRFAVTPGGLRKELPKFLKSLAAEGLSANFAVTDYAPAELAADPDLLMFLADSGIRAFRMGYFPYRPDVRDALREARETIERLSPMCSLSGITAVYQVHHGTLISSASAAWNLVRGLPNSVSIQLDAGNERIEGYEAWPYAIRLLGGHLAAIGIKDVRLGTPNEWVELGEGQVEWKPLFDALSETNYEGILDVMPFYGTDRGSLASDISFVREHLKAQAPKRDRPARTLLDL